MSRQVAMSELFKGSRRNYIRRKVVLRGINDLIQFDLADLSLLSQKNGGVKYLLVGINCFSKKGFAIPMKNKLAATTAAAAEKILNQSRTNFRLAHTDQGSEFAGDFKRLLQRRNIRHYFTWTKTKASICERFIRTLKTNILRDCAMRGSERYVDDLTRILREYNSKKHRTIKMAPNEVNARNEQLLLNTVYNYDRPIVRTKFAVGDRVRVSNQKGVFDKSYWANWSPQLYVIKAVNRKYPPTYRLTTADGLHDILGTYYESELQKTKQADVYIVDHIVRRRGNRVLVKWLGYPSSHNSWELATNIVAP